MDLPVNDQLEQVAKVTAATTVVGGGILWLLREKVARWVKTQTHSRLERIETSVEHIDKLIAARAIQDATHAAQFVAMRDDVTHGFARMTRSMEHIEGRIDKLMEAK